MHLDLICGRCRIWMKLPEGPPCFVFVSLSLPPSIPLSLSLSVSVSISLPLSLPLFCFLRPFHLLSFVNFFSLLLLSESTTCRQPSPPSSHLNTSVTKQRNIVRQEHKLIRSTLLQCRVWSCAKLCKHHESLFQVAQVSIRVIASNKVAEGRVRFTEKSRRKTVWGGTIADQKFGGRSEISV